MTFRYKGRENWWIPHIHTRTHTHTHAHTHTLHLDTNHIFFLFFPNAVNFSCNNKYVSANILKHCDIKCSTNEDNLLHSIFCQMFFSLKYKSFLIIFVGKLNLADIYGTDIIFRAVILSLSLYILVKTLCSLVVLNSRSSLCKL